MKYLLTILTVMFCLLTWVNAQVEPGAGKYIDRSEGHYS